MKRVPFKSPISIWGNYHILFSVNPTWKSELNFPAFLAIRNMPMTQDLPIREAYMRLWLGRVTAKYGPHLGSQGVQLSGVASDTRLPKVLVVMAVIKLSWVDKIGSSANVAMSVGGAVGTGAIFPSDKFYNPLLGTVPRTEPRAYFSSPSKDTVNHPGSF